MFYYEPFIPGRTIRFKTITGRELTGRLEKVIHIHGEIDAPRWGYVVRVETADRHCGPYILHRFQIIDVKP